MSNFLKWKYFMKKGSKIRHSEHYDNKHKNCYLKFCYDNFLSIFEKGLGNFSVGNIWKHFLQKSCFHIQILFFSANSATIQRVKKAVGLNIYQLQNIIPTKLK